MEDQDQNLMSSLNENTTYDFNIFKTPWMRWHSLGEAIEMKKLHLHYRNQEQRGNQILGAHDLQKFAILNAKELNQNVKHTCKLSE